MYFLFTALAATAIGLGVMAGWVFHRAVSLPPHYTAIEAALLAIAGMIIGGISIGVATCAAIHWPGLP